MSASRRFLTIAALAAFALSSLLPACQSMDPSAGTPLAAPNDVVDAFVATAPRILHSGQTERIALSINTADRPANAMVTVSLLKRNDTGKDTLATTTRPVWGRGNVELTLPQVGVGEYELEVSGPGFRGVSPVRVESGTVLFLETGKPIYKPGQSVHIRLITLTPALLPISDTVTIEAMDAKGTKVFRKELTTDEFGMASTDLPLSTEPNLGVWKLTAQTANRKSQLDIRVEEYVLPKYEVQLSLPRDWALVTDPITGTIKADYTYGKPVRGQVEIVAKRYLGRWEEYARVSKTIDGQLEFTLPPVKYASGVPAASGQANVTIEATVREETTGYEEKTTKMLTIAASATTLRLVPESVAFKPGLPLGILVAAQTPDNRPVDAKVDLELTYTKKDFTTAKETRRVDVKAGKAVVELVAPLDAISLTISAKAGAAYTSAYLQASYSPTGSFILVEQTGPSELKAGDTARFKVTATKEAKNLYYEVMSRGMIVFSDHTQSRDIAFTVTPAMAPTARLIVYQLLPNSEVVADYIPFAVQAAYPQGVTVSFSQPEVKPGDAVSLTVQTAGAARVGLAAVDKAVFVLAENRLNLKQVFDQLEALYQQPQAELHDVRPTDSFQLPGAKDTFSDVGLVVMTNQSVPSGVKYAIPTRAMKDFALGGAVPMAAATAPALRQDGANESAKGSGLDLAEVQRVRQFFPETWIWQELTTDNSGRATRVFNAPDSITTWMVRALAISKSSGLGIAEAQLKVFQPFFLTADLPYSAIRGERLPVRVSLYNYSSAAQQVTVSLEPTQWFELTGSSTQTVTLQPNGLGAASFDIRPLQLGRRSLKITARSPLMADAVEKEILIDPEGVEREISTNLVLTAGSTKSVSTQLPDSIIEGSARAFFAVSGNYLTQSIQGLESLLRMPFGCGEQNMILFAPNVFIARYLRETGQLKPEIMAKAESMMLTGYQRELTYRRTDGSFSAFGNSDKSGSLWLTAFVLKTFAQAKDLIYVDDSVLAASKNWITKQQKADGSFEPIGFVHHSELLGGLRGNTALTAYLAIALSEAGASDGAAKAIRHLESQLSSTEDTYALAITAYALAMAKSHRTAEATQKLLAAAKESEQGLYWTTQNQPVLPVTRAPGLNQPADRAVVAPKENASIETTAYAILALTKSGDRVNAGNAARWLVGQRNANGGFGSTQDTVVGLQALTAYALDAKSDIDATVVLSAPGWKKEIRLMGADADVLTVVDAPLGQTINIEVKGKGQAVVQQVLRYNVPQPEQAAISAFQLDVQYETGHIEVDDLINVQARIRYTPPLPIQAGMIVLDIAVPTGFAIERDSLAALAKQQPKLKRWDIAGRKAILYIEDMLPDEQLAFSFQARALYPVTAQAVTSQAYSYYRPEWRGESLGGALAVQPKQ